MNTSPRQILASLLAPCLLCLALLPEAGNAASINGSGRSASESRSLAEFQAISLHGSMDLVVRQGSTQSVQVEADDNLLPLLESVVEAGSQGATLQLRWKKGQSLSSRSKVLVTVVVSKLSALSAAGSGDVKVEAFNTPMLRLSISGSGDAKLLGLTADELGISISGSGDVAGNGSATRLKVSIAGSGDVRLSEMKADDVTVAIAGSGDAAVNANKTLEVKIAGSGDVSYTGNAAVKSSVAGSGGVTKR
jgi:carbon monoxide dehydrogenase subunit G